MKEFVLHGMGPQDLKINYQGELNEEQYRVVADGDGYCLVLAGAGSGKTRAVTYRVAWLLEHGVSPNEILLLTFTNKAAKEMVTRIESLLKSYPTGLWAGTFHSIANRMLRMEGQRTKWGRDFTILDEEDATALMKMCVKEIGPVTGVRFPSAAVIKSIASYAANARVTIAQVLERKHPSFLAFEETLVRIIARYREEKEMQKAMDFDDLLTELLAYLESDEHFRNAFARRFRYVIVDEFQDTNLIQADIVDKLSACHKNLLVVGDDAQSIYSFRAAEIKNILGFGDRYPGAKQLQLLTNYRSTPEILSIANAVIANNDEQYEKELKAAVKSGEKPLLVPAVDERQEAQYVAEQIITLLNEGASLSSMAVLFRAAFHSQALEFELMRRNIPYEYRGGMKFFERAHIKDAMAALRVLRNHKDQVAFMRLLQLMEGFGLATAGRAASAFASMDTIDLALAVTPKLSAKAQKSYGRMLHVLNDVMRQSSPAHMIRTFVGSDLYKGYLESEYPNYKDRLDDLEQFAVFAESYDALGPFLDAVTLTGDFGVTLQDTERPQEEDTRGDRLVLSTIHQAKGLEWDTVFILHLAEGMFPHGRAYGEEGGLSEERRLFYVAATRARQKLILAYPITAGYENVELKQPSPFIKEIPSREIEEVRLRTAYGGYTPPRATPKRSEWNDEPMIVLDDDGEKMESIEEIQKKIKKNFLGDY